MAARVTITDIARQAGVSPSTVSRALSGHLSISEPTRARIARIARDLNYRVDERARNFRMGRSRTVGLLFPYLGDSRRQLSDPFYLEIAGAISDALDARGYDMLMARVPADSDDWPGRYVTDKRVDGLLLVDRALDDPGIEALQKLDTPFVVWGHRLPLQDYVTVGGDSVAGAAAIVRHLAGLGRRRIGFIGGFAGMVETITRQMGYSIGLAECGIPLDESLILYSDFSPGGGREAMAALLEREPGLDGVFLCSDYMAVAAMEVIRASGRRVPEDVAVAGYDDVPLAAWCNPRLTTIHQSVHRGGALMVDLLFAMLDGQPAAPVTLPVHLVVRDSCGEN
ncbi:MAG: LacI family DNA-binding transcriptional regulator [Anaerolineae bacterium]|nr:LacI family DNA-binding transcriptional regulator [Anaerolineae bacterium]